MNSDIFRDLLDSESLYEIIDSAETIEEKQFLMLVVIRNNLNSLRDDLKAVKGWVILFGIVSIISMVITIF